jgi:hypothetical protein
MSDAARRLLGDSVGMYTLHLWDPNALEEVRGFLRRHRVRVHRESAVTARVSVPNASTPAHEQHELAGCVANWNALNPASPIELTAAVTSSHGACLELAAVEATDLYFERLASLTAALGFGGVMEQMESLTDESLVEYVASRYVTTLAGRSVLDKERLHGGDDQGSNSRLAHSGQ